EAVEGVGKRGCGRRELAARGVEQTRRRDEEEIAGAHLDGQRATVEAALQGLNLKRHAVVVDAVAAVDARVPVSCGPVEADARGEVVFVGAAVAGQEG